MIQEEVRLITEFASLAPSVHNTQPWRFVASEHALEVRADPSRRLEYLDGDTRQLHISCGAAVEFARLAIRALGYACVVRLAPAADDPTLLATITLKQPHGATPTADRTTTGPSLTTSSFA
jgi:nitroreductase